MSETNAIFNHLTREYGEPVKDPVWRNIGLSRGLMRIAAHPAFQKLNGVKQLGPTYLVYPGATHTRLNHSLGVVHMARRMMLHLLAGQAARASGASADAVTEDLSLEGVKAFLCAALLHDLGHYPYAHSLKDVGLRSHEALTAERILQQDLCGLIRNEVGADPHLVAAIVDPDLSHASAEELAFFRNLLSGVLDPDKLDYLSRDAYFCGVPHGTQDVDFVLAEIRAHRNGLAVTRKGLVAVESILFSKYLMYKTVYWHKTVRIATAMIKKAVLLALEEAVIRPQDLYWLDDSQFFSLAASRDYPPLQLVNLVGQRQLYKLAASVCFDAENPLHVRLQDVRSRLAFERQLCRRLEQKMGGSIPEQSLILDIPEPINFEIDLPILDGKNGESTEYEQSRSVFNRDSVSAFVRSLRTISLFTESAGPLSSFLARIDVPAVLREGLSVLP